jgi:hypothetical protein
VADADGGSVEATDEAAPEGGSTGAGGDVAASALDLTRRDRDVVRTGEMWVTVDDVVDATTDVRALAGEAEGFVADEQVRAEDDIADLTLRVPADDFDGVRDAVGELGEITEQQVQADDVTADMVDLDSRIASLQASVERLRSLLAEAGDVSQLAVVEGELTTRETELEALLGQQRVLADQVALATLTLHLGEDAPAPGPADDIAGFGESFHRGWVGLIDIGRVALAVAGFLLPFAVPAALVAVLTRWWLHRRRDAIAAAKSRI